jgi:hypothetical protein
MREKERESERGGGGGGTGKQNHLFVVVASSEIPIFPVLPIFTFTKVGNTFSGLGFLEFRVWRSRWWGS